MPLLTTSEILAEDNIRHKLDENSVKELAQSILTVHELSNGEKTLLQPIVVEKLKQKKNGKTHQLRYGFRRLAAMQYLEETYPDKCFWAKNIPVIVDEAVYNEEAGALQNFRLIENIQREDMTLLEEAMTLQRIMKENGLKQTDLAKALGKSKGWVSQRLSLLKLDEAIQLGVQDGTFGQAHVRELARAKKKSDQKDLAAKLLKKDKPPSVEDVRRAVDAAINPDTEKKTKPKKEATKKSAPTQPAPTDEEWEMSAEEREKQDVQQLKTSKKGDTAPAPKEAPDVKVSEDEEAQAPEPTLEDQGPSRRELLQSMSHDEKLAIIKAEAAERKQADAIRAEIARCEKKMAAAKKLDHDAEVAHYNGAIQGLEFALGSLDSVQFIRQKKAS